MKRIVVIVICLAAVAGLVWLVWFKPAKPEEAEKKPETEVPVQVGKLKRVTLHGYVTAYGTVEPEPAGERPAASARVVAAVAGVVTEVKCAEGQRVEKGAVLFQLDTRAADVAVDFAEKTLERQRKLVQIEEHLAKGLAGRRATTGRRPRAAGAAASAGAAGRHGGAREREAGRSGGPDDPSGGGD